MHVERAKTAGFCMGVSLALEKLERAIASHAPRPGHVEDGRICTLGPIIHNPQVLQNFASQGVICIDDPAMAKPGDCVIIRAHGIPRQAEERLRSICYRVVDATCPKVKKAQLAIRQATAAGATLLLFGEADHPEVAGLVSYAHARACVFGSPAELRALSLPVDGEYVLASQTTQDRDIFADITMELVAGLPRISVLSTICDATRMRQEEALRIASRVDVMVVAGGHESGNTRRLAAIAKQAGIETYHVERLEELKAENFVSKQRAGLTAGASTPKSLIDATEKWLETL